MPHLWHNLESQLSTQASLIRRNSFGHGTQGRFGARSATPTQLAAQTTERAGRGGAPPKPAPPVAATRAPPRPTPTPPRSLAQFNQCSSLPRGAVRCGAVRFKRTGRRPAPTLSLPHPHPSPKFFSPLPQQSHHHHCSQEEPIRLRFSRRHRPPEKGKWDQKGLQSCEILETAGQGALGTLYKVLESAIADRENGSSAQGQIIWVHFGVNSGASRFALENQAVNEATFRCPDELGWKPQRVPIVPSDGSISRTRETTLPVKELTKSLRRQATM
ncbi:hypothetical protein ZWY2020_009358 [Hordeum vulgare]|nr:hypothetical protein ZWY2020_009358 [Hordeum vulgare]